MLLGMLHELEASQWLPPAELAARQAQTLDALVAHARATVPYYRDHPGYAAPRPWAELPILSREQVQAAGPALVSTAIPADHLPLTDMTTWGSTGRPVTVKATGITGLLWLVCTLREHQWHGRDPTTKVATLRPDRSGQVPAEGALYPSWGPPIDTVYDTGPVAAMAVQQDVAVQAEFLVAHDPTYLLSLPSNLMALCEHFARTGARLPSLREARSYGEVLGPEVRDACRRVWGVPVTDMYSSQELGYLALQCPTSERYHVMSELVVVEVLDEQGRACPPGETGRVVVTQLHNYAMPLLRYDLGDYAQVGEPCSCGRGLPVLDRVVGRRRNMLRLPTGEVLWPTFGSAWKGLGDVIQQFQLVQQDLDHIHARIVGPRGLTADEQSTVAEELRRRFGYPFRVTFEFLSAIGRAPGAKFEDFVSMVGPESYTRPAGGPG
jgi:phenylacetate-CoA ligase